MILNYTGFALKSCCALGHLLGEFPAFVASCSFTLLRFCSVAICWQLLSVCILSVKNVCGPPYPVNEFYLTFFSMALFPALHYVCCFLVHIPVRLFSSLFSVALVPFVGKRHASVAHSAIFHREPSLPLCPAHASAAPGAFPPKAEGISHAPAAVSSALTLSSAYVSPFSSSTILVVSDILIAHMDYSYFITNWSC